MTNENGNALELLECYESCMAGEAGCAEFIYLAENEAEVVKEFNAIYTDVRKNHRGVMSVSIDQAKNKIVFTKAGDSKPEAPAGVVEPKKWPSPAVELPEIIQELQPEGDCETPEDCEDGFEGDNLT